ncbi:hypothetical protein TNCV_2649421 [Trichonephila clavipes]|nr:hypothetical protein TNCV_2649421 [Trichonephila clavipes]
MAELKTSRIISVMYAICSFCWQNTHEIDAAELYDCNAMGCGTQYYSKNMHEMRVTELSMRDSISSESETILPSIMTSPRKSAQALSGTEASRQTAAKCTSPKGFPAWRDTILMRIFKPGAFHN